ncbi:MAG TPA: response regulator [Caulobacteraceae bacterium]|nr:response regulator [Caulobacteraceae bacterium]
MPPADIKPEPGDSPGVIVIAIVEDDESFREAVAGLIDAIGFQAAQYASAEAFLDSDGPLTSACLITDVQLPGMSGLELSRRLIELGIAIPTIVVTANPRAEIRQAAVAQGALALFDKPIDGAALSDLIHAALRSK